MGARWVVFVREEKGYLERGGGRNARATVKRGCGPESGAPWLEALEIALSRRGNSARTAADENSGRRQRWA